MSLTLPGEVIGWLDEEADRQVIGRDLLVECALRRLRSDLEAYGWVEPLPPPAPGMGRAVLARMRARLARS